MSNIAGTHSRLVWAVNLSVILLVVLWIIPTTGLLVSSFRDRDQIASSGWWRALFAAEQNFIFRSEPPDSQIEADGGYVLEGNILSERGGEVIAFGTSSRDPAKYLPGETGEMSRDRTMVVNTDGSYRIFSMEPHSGSRGARIFATTREPPRFTFDNYNTVLFSEGLGTSFLNTMSVTIPATVIPILVAAFAAYALAWMQFPGRAILIAAVVGLLVVPLQLAFIPLLKLHNNIGIGKEYIGIWLAHTGFGLPLAIYLLRNYMVGLPREIIESARVDGATEFEIFQRIVLPLSFPALASFAIFQFLWVWNDLLVATVFLGTNEDQLVMTGRLRELLGSRGGDWEILAASAFISIVVPLVVFFAMQRYLVRGLLAGSVKGG